MLGAPSRILSRLLRTQSVKWNISYTVHQFFLITKRQLVKAASWARVVRFPFSAVFKATPRCSLSFPSCIARGYLTTMLKEKDGLHNSYFNLFESLTNDRL